MIVVRNEVLVLQKRKQVETRVDVKEKRVGSKNEIVSLIGTRTLTAGVAAFNAVTTAEIDLQTSGKFPSALTVTTLP